MKFINQAHEQQFQEKGYVIVPLLNEEQVKDMYAEFDRIRSYHPFAFSLSSPDYGVKKHIAEVLGTTIKPLLHPLIEGFRLTGANYYFKPANSQNNAVPPHQDWTFTDETKHFSLNIWLPLVDVTKENGAYHIIEGSHRWPLTFRGSNIPSACSKLVGKSWEELTYLPLKKGEAIIYDHRLIHATPPNISTNDRISLVLNLIPQEAELIHCIKPEKDSNKVEVYSVDEEFYYRFVFNFAGNTIPFGYKKIKEFNYEAPAF